jgi:hypothetical protein
MKSASIAALLLVVLLGATGFPLSAQHVISAQAGLINYTEGPVLLNGRESQPTRGVFPQMKEEDMLRTTTGRAELLLSPGVFLRVGRGSSFRLVSDKVTDSKVELLTGSLVLEAGEIQKNMAVTLMFGDATISIRKRGLYRLAAEPAELRVFDGKAAVEAGGTRVELGRGRRLALDGDAVAVKFNRKNLDSLDQWSSRRAEYLAFVNLSTAQTLMNRGSSLRCNGWCFNSFYGLVTFVPMSGYYFSPYGYYFYSPRTLYQSYSQAASYGSDGGGGSGYSGSSSGSGAYAGSSSRVSPPASIQAPSGMSSGRVAPPAAQSPAPGGGRVSPN